MGEVKIAVIDLGTVSSRMLCATIRDGIAVDSIKRTAITDLGEGVDSSGSFSPRAIERVAAACGGFVDEARAYGASCACTTLTSAARDAANSAALLDRLRELGLDPQVISGQVEARLTFYGVARDFPAQRIAVADSGGGSTELVVGRCDPEGASPALDLDRSSSLDIGCRRVTERFFPSIPPLPAQIARATAWMRPQFEGYWKKLPSRPDRLVAVGGTVTSLVALSHGLAVYDSRLVHLRDLSIDQVEEAIGRMVSLDVEGTACLPGIQPKRAPVILAGALTVRELMRAGGYARLTVSENGLLAGLSTTVCEVLRHRDPAIGWRPRFSDVCGG